MIRGLATIIAIVIVADILAAWAQIPVPGAALGLIGLTAMFLLLGGPDKGIDAIFDAASPHFPFFFVPAATGLVGSGDILASAWIEVAVAVVVGTAVTIAVTGLVTQALFRFFSRAKAV